MATLMIGDIDAAVTERLRGQAAAHGSSMEAEARRILERALQPTTSPFMPSARERLVPLPSLEEQARSALKTVRDDQALVQLAAALRRRFANAIPHAAPTVGEAPATGERADF